MNKQLEPDRFHVLKERARERARERSLVDLVQELVGYAENGETMTAMDAHVLATAYEIEERFMKEPRR